MDFKTTKAEVTLQHLNYALGLRSDVDLFTKIDKLKILWTADIVQKDWGIKSIDVNVMNFYVEIEWEIYKEDLDNYQKTQLMCKSHMFHSVSETSQYIIGNYKIFGNMFNIIENLEVNGGILEIEEVLIDFIENEIHIL